MRDLTKVIDEMLPYVEKEELKVGLERVKKDLFFRAPERIVESWDEVSILLGTIIPNPTETEKTLKIASIFTTRTEQQIKDDWENRPV